MSTIGWMGVVPQRQRQGEEREEENEAVGEVGTKEREGEQGGRSAEKGDGAITAS